MAWGKERGFEIVTEETEWIEKCTGAFYCPTFRCLECNEEVTSTCIASLQREGSIGCSCHNKTERKLLEWLQTRYSCTKQYPSPTTDCGGQTHFDFHLTLADGCEVFIELDGPQHFWRTCKYYTDEGAERDVLKERWAIERGIGVIRVLQEDVWDDRLNWDGWLVRSIAAAQTGEARVLVPPDAPEYRSTESAYVVRRSECTAK